MGYSGTILFPGHHTGNVWFSVDVFSGAITLHSTSKTLPRQVSSIAMYVLIIIMDYALGPFRLRRLKLLIPCEI
jgi:ABC-type uncharacterized transport system YnjBCD permease subunit